MSRRRGRHGRRSGGGRRHRCRAGRTRSIGCGGSLSLRGPWTRGPWPTRRCARPGRSSRAARSCGRGRRVRPWPCGPSGRSPCRARGPRAATRTGCPRPSTRRTPSGVHRCGTSRPCAGCRRTRIRAQIRTRTPAAAETGRRWPHDHGSDRAPAVDGLRAVPPTTTGRPREATHLPSSPEWARTRTQVRPPTPRAPARLRRPTVGPEARRHRRADRPPPMRSGRPASRRSDLSAPVGGTGSAPSGRHRAQEPRLLSPSFDLPCSGAGQRLDRRSDQVHAELVPTEGVDVQGGRLHGKLAGLHRCPTLSALSSHAPCPPASWTGRVWKWRRSACVPPPWRWPQNPRPMTGRYGPAAPWSRRRWTRPRMVQRRDGFLQVRPRPDPAPHPRRPRRRVLRCRHRRGRMNSRILHHFHQSRLICPRWRRRQRVRGTRLATPPAGTAWPPGPSPSPAHRHSAWPDGRRTRDDRRLPPPGTEAAGTTPRGRTRRTGAVPRRRARPQIPHLRQRAPTLTRQQRPRCRCRCRCPEPTPCRRPGLRPPGSGRRR